MTSMLEISGLCAAVNGTEILKGIDLTIQYDPEVFELIGYNNENSSLDNSVYSTIINENTPGVFKLISYAAAQPIDYKGILGYLQFQMISNTTTHSTIWIDEMKVNAISEGGFLIGDGAGEGSISRGYDFNIISLPAAFNLQQNYPNPFNPTTTMKLFMPVAGDMEVEVYNLLGQVVATLASGYMDMGTYTLTWDASDAASSMYFVKAQADGFTKTQKLMLVK